MSSKTYKCPHCDKDDFTTQRGLTQHLQKSRVCSNIHFLEEEAKSGYHTAQEGIAFTVVQQPITRKRLAAEVNADCTNTRHNRRVIAKNTELNRSIAAKQQEFGSMEENYETAREDEGDALYMASLAEEDDDSFADHGNIAPQEENLYQKRKLLEEFREYTAYAKRHFVPFSKDERTAIKCMATLRKTRASLGTYNSVMEWHLKANKVLKPHEKLGDTKQHITRDRLFASLKRRYNIKKDYYGQVKRVTLPSSKATVNIVCNDAGAMLRSLLTDPRISKKDYLFHDDDPFAPPPADLGYIRDLNTGLSYLETYKQRITKPDKQILLAVPMYADGCVTGQFANLALTQVKMTVGILNAQARDKDYFWRDIGLIPNVSAQKSRGSRMMLESRHCDGLMAHQDVLEEEGARRENAAPVNKLEDYHTMIGVILESYLDIQDGIILDFHYNGKLYKDVEFLLFIPHVKVDNEEADKFCGKFGTRSGNVAHICRQCEVPTTLSGRALVKYPLKTQSKIADLVEAKDLEALRGMSQHCFENAWYPCNFGLHNQTGIHGACPIDMLHTIYLGLFMRLRDGFFQQIGPTSETANDIDALAKEYGELLGRQSERNMPKSKFSGGIMGGKLMGKEFEGVLLLIAVILRSKKGRRLLRSSRSGNFTHDYQLDDWTLLVETLLGWVQWLKGEQMQRVHVESSAWKHRYLMYLYKKVIRRTKGMGMKFPKFHLIAHLTDDILNHGIPRILCTSPNESGHKVSKIAALLTQKCLETFDWQTLERLLETHLLALALKEMEGRPLWEYLDGYEHNLVDVEPVIAAPMTGGSTFKCTIDEETEEHTLEIASKMRYADGLFVEADFVNFVGGLQDLVGEFVEDMAVRTEHSRNGQMFRAHIKYRGRVWRDWVEVDWDDWGKLPNKIWGFVDLGEVPENCGINYGGLDLKPGVYAIVESAAYLNGPSDGQTTSDIFVPIRKEVGKIVNGAVTDLKFYLADVEAFVAPLTVIPDIGGRPSDYFVVKNREEWREDFEAWLETPNEDSLFTMSDDESDDEDYNSEEENMGEDARVLARRAARKDEHDLANAEMGSGDEATLLDLVGQ